MSLTLPRMNPGDSPASPGLSRWLSRRHRRRPEVRRFVPNDSVGCGQRREPSLLDPRHRTPGGANLASSLGSCHCCFRRRQPLHVVSGGPGRVRLTHVEQVDHLLRVLHIGLRSHEQTQERREQVPLGHHSAPAPMGAQAQLFLDLRPAHACLGQGSGPGRVLIQPAASACSLAAGHLDQEPGCPVPHRAGVVLLPRHVVQLLGAQMGTHSQPGVDQGSVGGGAVPTPSRFPTCRLCLYLVVILPAGSDNSRRRTKQSFAHPRMNPGVSAHRPGQRIDAPCRLGRVCRTVSHPLSMNDRMCVLDTHSHRVQVGWVHHHAADFQ